MDAIWGMAQPAVTVREVLDVAYADGSKAYTTVQTLMNSLVKKGFLRRQRTGLAYAYMPTRGRGPEVQAETERFVNRVFEGSFGALASFLVKSRNLTERDIFALRALIESAEAREETE